MREGTTSRMMVADRPYGEFYDFYSISLECFGYTLAYIYQICSYPTYLVIVILWEAAA
jgi:hypothetical protein